MKKGRLVILSGPSGSGKTTLYQKLLKDPRFRKTIIRSVSLTTRPPRPNEKDGRDYFFVSRKKFAYKKKAGHLLESQKVFQDYYGTPLKPVREALRQGKNVLLAIDVKGARIVRRKIPGCLMIFVKPPSLVALKNRLAKRGTEKAADLNGRLARARMEIHQAADYDYALINDDLAVCYRRLQGILIREGLAG